VHVFGRQIGGAEDFPYYSTDLQRLHSTGATWDVEMLVRFIEEPRALAPNTNMPNLHLTRAQAIDIAKALSGLK